MFSEDDLTKKDKPKAARPCRPWQLRKREDVKKLGGSSEKTLPTKQDYFGGAFKKKILDHSRPVRVKIPFSNQRTCA